MVPCYCTHSDCTLCVRDWVTAVVYWQKHVLLLFTLYYSGVNRAGSKSVELLHGHQLNHRVMERFGLEGVSKSISALSAVAGTLPLSQVVHNGFGACPGLVGGERGGSSRRDWFGSGCWDIGLLVWDEEAMEEGGSVPGTPWWGCTRGAQPGEPWCPWPQFSWESSGKVFFPAPWRTEVSFQAFVEQNYQLMPLPLLQERLPTPANEPATV